MENRNPHPYRPLFAILVLLLVAACNGPEDPEAVDDRDQSGTATDTEPLDLKRDSIEESYLQNFGTRNPFVGKKEFDCVVNDFRNYVHQGASSVDHSAIASFPGSLRINVKDLREKAIDPIKTCANPGAIPHAITVHYGLDINNAFTAALQVQCTVKGPQQGEHVLSDSNDIFSIGADGVLTLVAGGLTGWSKGDGARYQNRVYVQPKPGGPWRRFELSLDPRAIVFPYEKEIMDLIDHNQLAEGKLELVPIATPQERKPDGSEDRYFHGICWIPVGHPITDEANGPYPFKDRAANLGSPCPPSCPKTAFVFQTVGPEPRAACKL